MAPECKLRQIKENTQKVYEKVGADYDSWYWNSSSRRLREMLKSSALEKLDAFIEKRRAELGNGKWRPRILDVCCGTGYLVQDLSKRGTYTGVDFAESMISLCKERFPGKRFLQADAEDLPFWQNSFDVVVCFWSFHHITDPQTAICEFHRVMDRDGLVLIATFKNTRWNPLAMLADSLSNLYWGFRTYRYDKKGMEALMHMFNNVNVEIFPRSLRSIWGKLGIQFLIATGEK